LLVLYFNNPLNSEYMVYGWLFRQHRKSLLVTRYRQLAVKL